VLPTDNGLDIIVSFQLPPPFFCGGETIYKEGDKIYTQNFEKLLIEYGHDYVAIYNEMDKRDIDGFMAFSVPTTAEEVIVKADFGDLYQTASETTVKLNIGYAYPEIFSSNRCMRHRGISVHGMDLPKYTIIERLKSWLHGQDLPENVHWCYAMTRNWTDEEILYAFSLDGVKEAPIQPFWIIRWYIQELKREKKMNSTSGGQLK